MRGNGNGNAAAPPAARDILGSFSIEEVAAEVDRLNAEIARIAAAGPTLAEELGDLGRELQRDIELFRDHGLAMDFSLSPQYRERLFSAMRPRWLRPIGQ